MEYKHVVLKVVVHPVVEIGIWTSIKYNFPDLDMFVENKLLREKGKDLTQSYD